MLKPRWSLRAFGPPHAPPVLLLHSIATSGDMWLPQVGAWSAQRRCLVVDLPGHGATPAQSELGSLEDYARELMTLIDAPRVAIVGLSLGGMIAQACALNYGERVGRIVIANSLSQVSPVAREHWDARVQAAEANGMASQAEETLARWFTPAFRAASPLTMQWIRSLIRDTQLEGYRCAVRAIQKLDYFERLVEIRCPSLVITGREDPVATPAVSEAMAGRIPGARHKVLTGASHLSNIENPVCFAEAVGAFLLESG